MSEENNVDKPMNWDDTIEHDSADFVLLPEGEYNFEVKSFRRETFSGSAKMGACPMAVLDLEVFNADTSRRMDHNLYLNKKTEGLLCEFFRAIGQRKHGEPLRMNWAKVPGSKGRCKIIQKELESTKKLGEKFLVNNIKKFLDPEPEEDNAAF